MAANELFALITSIQNQYGNQVPSEIQTALSTAARIVEDASRKTHITTASDTGGPTDFFLTLTNQQIGHETLPYCEKYRTIVICSCITTDKIDAYLAGAEGQEVPYAERFILKANNTSIEFTLPASDKGPNATTPIAEGGSINNNESDEEENARIQDLYAFQDNISYFLEGGMERTEGGRYFLSAETFKRLHTAVWNWSKDNYTDCGCEHNDWTPRTGGSYCTNGRY